MVEIFYPHVETFQVVSSGLRVNQFEQEISDTKTAVEAVLANSKIARNSDQWLVFHTWIAQGLIKVTDTDDLIIRKNDIPKLFKSESITRLRRYINHEEGKFLPDDPKVVAKRRLISNKYKEEFQNKKK